MVHEYPYSSNGEHIRQEDGVSDYVARSGVEEGEDLMPDLKFTKGVQDFRNTNPSIEFCWGLADVLGNLTIAGMQMTHFKEYPYSNFCKMFTNMTAEKIEEGIRYHSVGPMLPLMYSIEFKKPFTP